MSGWLQKLRSRFARRHQSLDQSSSSEVAAEDKRANREATSSNNVGPTLSPRGQQTPSTKRNPWVSSPAAGSLAAQSQVPPPSDSAQGLCAGPNGAKTPRGTVPSPPPQGSPWVNGRCPNLQAGASDKETAINSSQLPKCDPSVTNQVSAVMLAHAANALKVAHQVSFKADSLITGPHVVPRKIILAGTFATEATRLKSEGTLRTGMHVTLKHIPNNPHDPRAIEVTLGGIRVGWIPRSKNEQLLNASAIQLSWKILAIKTVKKQENQIAIEIYSPDLFKMKTKPRPTRKLPSVKYPEFGSPDELKIVYKILCQSRIIYVGSTIRGLKTRKSQHLSALRRGSHTNADLQEAFDTYGEDELRFVRTRSSDDGESIRVRELNVMQKYKPKEYKKTKQRLSRFSI
jgi:hypothetical protein